MKYPEAVHSKLPQVGTTIFTVMSQLANDHGAINLSQGFPDFEVDQPLIDMVSKHMKLGANQYAPLAGAMPLRERIASFYEQLCNRSYDPETEITVTAGGTQALYTAISAFIKEGDEVIVFTPAYDSYIPAIEINGGKVHAVQTHAPYYEIDWESVKRLVSRRTKMIIINSPHNPSGQILNAQDLLKLEKLVEDKDIIVLSDEVYGSIIFDGYEHQSAARLEKLASQSMIVGSFGKTFHITGWKVGYIVGPENLMSEFRKVHQFNVFSVNHPVQLALAEYMGEQSRIDELGSFYQRKRDLFNDGLKGSKWIVRPSAGTYFQLLDYKKISEEKDVDLARRLTVEKRVASIPVSVFYSTPVYDSVLRFCFAKKDETIKRATELLSNIEEV